jgi:epoxyqueuosine reductase QueG
LEEEAWRVRKSNSNFNELVQCFRPNSQNILIVIHGGNCKRVKACVTNGDAERSAIVRIDRELRYELTVRGELDELAGLIRIRVGSIAVRDQQMTCRQQNQIEGFRADERCPGKR